MKESQLMRVGMKQLYSRWHEFMEPLEKQSDKYENADLPVGATPSIQTNNADNPDSDDDWTEAESEDMQLTGTLDTMLTPEFHEQSQLAYCVAPGEVNRPMGLFQDSLSEIVTTKLSHAKTCRKKRQGVCRFGFPIPPMPRTMILTPLEVEGNANTTELYKCIRAYLDDLKLAEDITDTFEDMLTKLGSTERDYILAIRSSITSDKIFLKRSPSEVRINGYNKVLLETWRANMDIQYVSTHMHVPCTLYLTLAKDKEV
ncbi:hypothetical protein BSL78_03288 [Apostichopus japonicus]|uniref:Uncharacterized protein n=1 Tax=Stichopus japonicus TaxID=307972 RepID=A0A2G8LHV9_STIJA|nr:hypothetical protein BSL78_03288 [Apostichopus japonicus]